MFSGDKHPSLDELNSLLSGEISAVETYKKAIEHIDDRAIQDQLEMCQINHARRAQMLRQRVQQLGGTPTETSGLWGTFANVVQAGANVFGDKSALNVLEEGEDKGLRDYESKIKDLDPETRSLVEMELLPQQRETHRLMSDLKKMRRGH